ncbi:DUF308 domain-containing protein [Echinicola sp. CAU 1574]|uniref:DUF308 domain-containing protein n=1 Tax=Echinicola arenosa TaxID=2774144 RepID=A0ABR9AKN7_9BACT|nr:DUF308 domain-containing protein [Echinicola arenosa]MBD8489114.1 DUF308 domain-containing protein [Echinicola arenosa]
MKMKYMIQAICLLALGYLSYQYSWFAFLLLALMVGVLLYIGIASVVWLIRNRLAWRRLRVPLILVAMIIICLGIGLLKPLPEPIVRTQEVGDDLRYAHSTDQGDRMNLKFFLPPFKEQMKARDSLRLVQVREMIQKGKIEQPRDKFYASFILHHNPMKDSSVYKLAHDLARQAAAEPTLAGEYQVQWLSKATYDRWMLSIGQPQKYGPQGGVSFSIE